MQQRWLFQRKHEDIPTYTRLIYQSVASVEQFRRCSCRSMVLLLFQPASSHQECFCAPAQPLPVESCHVSAALLFHSKSATETVCPIRVFGGLPRCLSYMHSKVLLALFKSILKTMCTIKVATRNIQFLLSHRSASPQLLLPNRFLFKISAEIFAFSSSLLFMLRTCDFLENRKRFIFQSLTFVFAFGLFIFAVNRAESCFVPPSSNDGSWFCFSSCLICIRPPLSVRLLTDSPINVEHSAAASWWRWVIWRERLVPSCATAIYGPSLYVTNLFRCYNSAIWNLDDDSIIRVTGNKENPWLGFFNDLVWC